MDEQENLAGPELPQAALTPGQKKFMATLGGGLFVIIAAAAIYLYSLGAFDERLSFDRTWAYCEPGDRCTAIRAPCETWIAVNNRDLDKARAYYDHMIGLVEASPQMECASPPQSDIQPAALCVSGLCITAR